MECHSRRNRVCAKSSVVGWAGLAGAEIARPNPARTGNRVSDSRRRIRHAQMPRRDCSVRCPRRQAAVLNRYTALGIPVTEPEGKVRPGEGELCSNPDCAKKPRYTISPEPQDTLAGDEGLAQTQVKVVQEAAISLSKKWHLRFPSRESDEALPIFENDLLKITSRQTKSDFETNSILLSSYPSLESVMRWAG